MSPFHFRLSAAKNLSSFQLLPASLITDLLQLFLGLPFFLFPWGFQSKAAFGISPSSFLNVWPIHLNFLFRISTFTSSESLFILSLFRQSTSTCFGHICSPSSGGILCVCNNLYVLCFSVDCLLAGLGWNSCIEMHRQRKKKIFFSEKGFLYYLSNV